jgi:hypothetical protein
MPHQFGFNEGDANAGARECRGHRRADDASADDDYVNIEVAFQRWIVPPVAL